MGPDFLKVLSRTQPQLITVVTHLLVPSLLIFLSTLSHFYTSLLYCLNKLSAPKSLSQDMLFGEPNQQHILYVYSFSICIPHYDAGSTRIVQLVCSLLYPQHLCAWLIVSTPFFVEWTGMNEPYLHLHLNSSFCVFLLLSCSTMGWNICSMLPSWRRTQTRRRKVRLGELEKEKEEKSTFILTCFSRVTRAGLR